MSTAIHRRVDALRQGADPSVIARLRSGWLVLASPQVTPGYCLLLPDPVVSDLNALTGAERHQFLQDMADCGDVLRDVLGAIRINYAMFGNVEPALHAHLFPRYHDEPSEQATAQPWALDWTAARAVDPSRDGPLITLLANAIRQRVDGSR
jgi:diadenosine tetraphosphate (Ap4A) HIT family hydrolase